MITKGKQPKLRHFDTIEEAKAALAPELGKYREALVEIGGKRVVVVGSDCVYDAIWSDLLTRLKDTLYSATPNCDLAVEEASRLRDEFISSLKRVYGVDDVITANDEF